MKKSIDPLFALSTGGQMAQTVDPNPKCNGCLHYDAQRGQGGVCTIGLRPYTCGQGDMPTIGYAPLADLHADFQPMAPTAHPSDGRNGKDTVAIAMKTLALGEEHVAVVKSDVARHNEINGNSGAFTRYGESSLSTAGYRAVNAPPADVRMIAKSVIAKLSNAEQFVLGADAAAFVTEFVEQVVKGEERVPVLRKSVQRAALVKGFYGHEWLAQFKGTDLFDEAVAICEEEIANEEEKLKTRAERTKQRRAIEAKLAEASSPYDDDMYVRDDKLRMRKDKLQIRLAKLQQKQLTTPEKVSKGVEGDDMLKSDLSVDTSSSGYFGEAPHGRYHMVKVQGGVHSLQYTPRVGSGFGSTQKLSSHSSVNDAVRAMRAHHAKQKRRSRT